MLLQLKSSNFLIPSFLKRELLFYNPIVHPVNIKLMKVTNRLSLMVIFLLFLSCSKSESKEGPEESYKSSIRSCACINDKNNDSRLEATINGEKLCFDRKQVPIQPDVWSINSWDSVIGAERYNKDSTLKLRIRYKNPQFNQRSLPYTLDYYCESMSVELINLKAYKFCDHCPTDDSYYFAVGPTVNLKTTILSFKDSIMEGSFEGNFSNRGSARFKVTNGYFKIRLVRQQ
jgi:hypothetical protein